jgi:hypothetical protein
VANGGDAGGPVAVGALSMDATVTVRLGDERKVLAAARVPIAAVIVDAPAVASAALV